MSISEGVKFIPIAVAVVPAAPAMTMMQVVVPPGVSPGQAFLVMTPSSSQMQVTCPAGVYAGMALQIQVPM